ncbi:MAG: hypothetical protein DCC49_11460 [Acidobacteria bacterium]|nr:MAG: hypothetical protein DCC49_11460 [Acidobacteriota bacterium]
MSEETPFAFPDVRRRLIGAICLVGFGVGLIIGALFWSAPAYNAGFPVAGIAVTLLGTYFGLAAWKLQVSEAEAIRIAAEELGFPIGPASVSVGWRGLRSRPIWRILVYSHEAPPKMRGLVLIDAVDGVLVSKIEEPNPEDWSGDDGEASRAKQ